MPARFDRLGIAFQYPENWTIDDSDAMLGRGSVTVRSPGGAFWSVAIHSASAEPHKLMAAVAEAMTEEYDSLEIADASETIAGRELPGRDFAFYCLDLTNTAQIRCLQMADSTYIVFCQAEDREFGQVAAVFRAMTTSLVSDLAS